jgi:hypothetical protein
MQQAVSFMWGKDETAVKAMHISIVYYMKYREMWTAVTTLKKCVTALTNLISLIWVLANQ